MRRQNRHRWLITAWFLIMGCILTVAYGQQYGTPYKGVSTYRSSYASISTNTTPTYEFQSTSAYTSSMGSSSFTSYVSEPFATSPMQRSIRKGGLGPSDDDPGIGEVHDPAPIGEPWILLVLAVAYLIYTIYKKKTIITK